MGVRLALSWACLASLGAVAADIPDQSKYAEPDDASYWGSSEYAEGALPPFPALRREKGLSRAEFDELLLDGQVFVVPNVSDSWAMKDWDCEFFRSDAMLSNAEMMQQYAAGTDAPDLVRFGDEWDKKETPSGASDEAAPSIAPFYWGIKDVQYEDAYRSPTWKKSMLKRVQGAFVLPEFMAPENRRSFMTTPEFWFAKSGAGAKAHMDTHVQATISVQLAGTKRWRLKPLSPRRAPYLAMIYRDGDAYERQEAWDPLFNITLQKGDALFFPPGMIHETLTLGDDCAASVTFQFSAPMAVRFYRRFFHRVRRTADIHESWPLIQEWALLGAPAKKLKKGLPYADALSKAPTIFAKVDTDQDGRLTLSEIGARVSDGQSALAWHDADEDGVVTAGEFAEGFAFWAATTFDVVESTPQEWRKFQLTDMEGDFNIEDLPDKVTNKMRKQMASVELAAARTEL